MVCGRAYKRVTLQENTKLQGFKASRLWDRRRVHRKAMLQEKFGFLEVQG